MKAYRASLLHMLEDPCAAPAEQACAFHEDGLLAVDGGHVVAFGAYADVAPALPRDVAIEHLPGRIIAPGFVDAHIHYPQTDVVGAWGARLLDWLTTHTFPVEQAFEDRAHADEAAGFFLDELLRNGTTSALVFGTVHKTSVEALFEAALARGMRIVGGKVLMDRNAPAALCDTVETGRADSEALIAAYRGRGRLGYAVTPRFAVTSSDAQLAMAGELAAAHPEILVHTHMSENLEEIETVAGLFPAHGSYLDVYDRFGLVGDRSVFAHCVHSEERDLRRLAEAGSTAAFCPSSNLMLGSGLFSLKQACACGAKVALGTDVGAGASFSLMHAIGEGYKVGQLQGEPLDPLHALYLATLAGARALRLEDRIGNLLPGKEADFVVIDPDATPLLSRRMRAQASLRDKLFALSIIGDDRAIERTYVAGRLAHARDGVAPRRV